MVRFFQSAYLSRYLLILLLAILFWTPTFITGTAFTGDSMPTFNLLLWVFAENFYTATAFALLLTLISALALNQICSEFGISEKVSTLAGFLFIVLSSSAGNFTTMSPFIPATFLLILLVRYLYSIPHNKNLIALAYNSGLLVGLAALFYTQIAFLILVVWIANYIHRSDTWRSYVVSVIGLATPFIFAFVWYFWTDRTSDFAELWINNTKLGNINQFLQMGMMDIITSAYIFVVVFFTMLNVLAGLREKNINLRRNLMITFYFFIITVLLVIFSAKPEGMYLFIIPSVILLVQALNKPSKERLLNFILSILILLVLINQCSKLFYLL